jgi:hypothetical protein
METKKIKTHLLNMENSTYLGEIFPNSTVTVIQVFTFYTVDPESFLSKTYNLMIYKRFFE